MSESTRSAASRRIGYAVTILVDAVLLVVANNLIEWGWFPWLTDDFEDVLPLVNVSLVATIVVNAVYLAFDPGWFKSLCELVLLGISMAVTIRLFQVFPFDFSDYWSGWATLARVVLVLAMIGIGIGMIVQLGKFLRAVAAPEGSSDQEQASH